MDGDRWGPPFLNESMTQVDAPVRREVWALGPWSVVLGNAFALTWANCRVSLVGLLNAPRRLGLA